MPAATSGCATWSSTAAPPPRNGVTGVLPTRLMTLSGANQPSRLARRSACVRTSAAKPPVSRLVGANRAQEVELTEGGPVDVGEVELAVAALPWQEAAQPHLAARPDDQIRIRMVGGVEVSRDRVCVDPVRHSLWRDAFRRERANNGACCVDELVAAAVTESDIQTHPITMGRLRLRAAGGLGQSRRKCVNAAEDADAERGRRTVAVRERMQLLDEHLDKGAELAASAREVLHRKRPDRHLTDPERPAPAQQLVELVRSAAVTRARDVDARQARPPAVAVKDHRDVLRQ